MIIMIESVIRLFWLYLEIMYFVLVLEKQFCFEHQSLGHYCAYKALSYTNSGILQIASAAFKNDCAEYRTVNKWFFFVKK